MSSHSVVVLFPRKRSVAARFKAGASEVIGEVIAFERTHARLAWCVTLVGVVIGLALQSL
jgi:hypothetical protein